MRQYPKMKEYKPPGEFKMERGARSTSVRQIKQQIQKQIVLDDEPTSPTLRTLQFEIKQSENPYQFKVPMDIINKKFKINEQKPKQEPIVLNRNKYSDNDFYHLVRGQRTLNQFRLNKVLTILQEPLKNYSKQEQSIARSSMLTDRSILTQRDISSPPKMENKYKLIRIGLVNYLNKLRKLNLTPNEVMNNRVFLKQPHGQEYSDEFFKAVKNSQLQEIQGHLKKNKYLVYDYDNALLTPLHWAAKRGLMEVAKMLIAGNADVDALDMAKRSCLYVACEYNQIEMIQLLLYSQANPWSNQLNYKSVIHDPITKQLFATSRKIHILLALTPPQQRSAIWSKEAPAMNSIKNVIVAQQYSIIK